MKDIHVCIVIALKSKEAETCCIFESHVGDVINVALQYQGLYVPSSSVIVSQNNCFMAVI